MNLVEKILAETTRENLFELVRKRIKSSNLFSVGYDSTDKTLEIRFRNGGVYQYYDVPQSVFFRLKAAASAGKFHNKNIKWHYDYERVN